MLNSVLNVLLMLLHPFYVSVTTVDYNEQAHRVEIGCRIFYDDLETALKNGRELKIDLTNPTDKSATDSLLATYFDNHVQLSVNGSPVSVRYVGYEIDEDVAWCFLEAVNIDRVKQLRIENRILFDHFPKQSNILHATAYGKRQSTKLDNPERTTLFEW
ncbi:DUF6702 family protein [Parapedobacter sp. 10938]|uniref:DUF6702 family protein n=1 Tax=Parapedobacter flavus TaxID=3110225 RepID=UPI002DBC4662|nr:DUF6702 family protein [Parapedobacter sp. 10938]MEC3881503.1 DUF6702 family protein [Parapedobacter sp. 10938]